MKTNEEDRGPSARDRVVNIYIYSGVYNFVPCFILNLLPQKYFNDEEENCILCWAKTDQTRDLYWVTSRTMTTGKLGYNSLMEKKVK